MTRDIASLDTERSYFLVLVVMTVGNGCVFSHVCYTDRSYVLSWPVYFTIFVFRIVSLNIDNLYINRWLRVSAPFPQFFLHVTVSFEYCFFRMPPLAFRDAGDVVLGGRRVAVVRGS